LIAPADLSANCSSLTIGHFHGGHLFAQAVGGAEGAEFDCQKFIYLGSLARVAPVCILSKDSGITSMDQWMNSKNPIKIGGTVPGVLAPHDTPKLLKIALGLPIIDTMISMLRRLLRSLHIMEVDRDRSLIKFFFVNGRSMFKADRDHIHHRLLKMGLTHRNAVFFLYGITLLLGVATFSSMAFSS
jgi:hypothetical protein